MAGEVQGINTIGVEVKLDTSVLHFVTDVGPIGGKPSALDATCMKDSMKKSVPGVQEGNELEITYLFDNTVATSDYRVVKGMQAAGDAVAVEVSFPDGTKFASTGYVTTYVEGTKVDSLITAKAFVNLQSEWTVTNPSDNG